MYVLILILISQTQKKNFKQLLIIKKPKHLTKSQTFLKQLIKPTSLIAIKTKFTVLSHYSDF